MATQQTATTQFIDVNDTKYGYRLIGEPCSDNPPLLLINHYRGTLDTWDPRLLNSLARTRLVITFDYSGIGWSTGPVASNLYITAADIVAFVNALLPVLPTPTSTVDVLGYSLGSLITQLLGIQAPPGLFRKLIIAGTSVGLSPRTESSNLEILGLETTDVTPENAINVFFPCTPTAQAAGREWWKRIHERDVRSEPTKTFTAPGETLDAATKAMVGWFADANPFTLLSVIKNEVLVAAGSADLLPPPRNAVEVGLGIKGARTVLFGSMGHGFIFQAGEEFVRLVVTFLEGVKDEN